MKLCEGCKMEKDFSAFEKDETIADGHAKYCRDCQMAGMSGIPAEKYYKESEVVEMLKVARDEARDEAGAEPAKCSTCKRVMIPNLDGVAKEFGMTQNAVKTHGFPYAVKFWIDKGMKCELCGEEHSLSITKDERLICATCLRAKKV